MNTLTTKPPPNDKALTIFNNRLGHMIVSKHIIEREAREAARKGQSLNDACPYPFASEAGVHFKAVYLLALPARGASGAPQKGGEA